MKAQQLAPIGTARKKVVPQKQKTSTKPVLQLKEEVLRKRSPLPPKDDSAMPAKPPLSPEPPAPSPRWPYVVLLVVGVLILGGAAAIAYGGAMTGWEHTIFVHINGAKLPEWVTSDIAKPISNAVWGILGLLTAFLLVPKYRLLAWQYLTAGISAYILTAIVEHVVDRARPQGLTHDVILRATQGGAGFPSGHVGVLAAICGTIWLFVSWPWRILLVLFVVAEAWSRLYLGVHAPLDVIGAIGTAFTVIGVLHLLPQPMKAFFRLHR